jgi:hypothetical protein
MEKPAKRWLPFILVSMGLGLCCGLGTLLVGAGSVLWVSKPAKVVVPPPPPIVVAEDNAALQGTWHFEEDCGKNAGDVPVYAGHSITITGNKVHAEANGYQTWLVVDGKLLKHGTDWVVQVERAETSTSVPTPGSSILTLRIAPTGLMVVSKNWPFICTEGDVIFSRG